MTRVCRSFTAPVWVSEFGTCNDWSYWAFNGTESTGASRAFGSAETYGVLDTQWSSPARASLLQALQARQRVVQTP